MDFKTSQTKDNLMRAFAGESQAKNRYEFAASVAKKQKLHIVELAFKYTSEQEKEHAKIFYNHLKVLNDSNITVDGSYPVNNYDDVLKLLRAAQHNEYQEYEHDYAQMAKIATEEGFPAIANSFSSIAAIEKTHGDRFGMLADMLENGKLFEDENEVAWICLNCGHIHFGKKAPESCPVCEHPQGYFLRNNLALFS